MNEAPAFKKAPAGVRFDTHDQKPKKFSRSERLDVAHYIRHGDQKCPQCNRGFDFYWVKGVR